MFIQVNDARGKPIKGIQVLLSTLGRNNPDGSPETDDKLTRDGGNVAWTWYPRDNPGGYLISVNAFETNPRYATETRTVTAAQLEGTQQVFQLRDVGTQPGPIPPGNFNPLDHSRENIFATARAWFMGLVRKHGLTTITEESLGVLKSDLNAVGIKLQNNDRGDYRPRLHFPPEDHNFHERNIDLGDFPGEGPNTTYGKVWEVRGWGDRW